MAKFKISDLQQQDNRQEIELQHGEAKLGRAEGVHIRVADPVISREHAKIIYTQDELKIIDLKSKNGLYVNGIKVTEADLYNGDKITIKNIIIDVECEFTKQKLPEAPQRDSNPGTIYDNEMSLHIYLGKDGKEPPEVYQKKPKNKITTTESIEKLELGFGIEDIFTSSSNKNATLNASLDSLPNDHSLDGTPDLNEPASPFDGGNNGLDFGGETPGAVSKNKAEETPAVKDSPIGSPLKAIGNILLALENATIKPMLTGLMFFEYRMLVTMLSLFGIGLIVLFVLFPMKTDMTNYLENEALSNAETVAFYLAEMNRIPLLTNDLEKINVKFTRTANNVRAARIIGKDGRIIAPIEERYQNPTQIYLVSAIESMRKAEVAPIKRVETNVFSVVSPIYAWTDNYKSYSLEQQGTTSVKEIFGLAQIEYDTRYIFSGAPYSSITPFWFLIQIAISLVIGCFIALLTFKLTIPVFSKLKETVKQIQRTGKSEMKPYLNLRELDDFLQALEETINSAKPQDSGSTQARDLLAQNENNVASNDTIEAYQCALDAIDYGIIVIDKQEIIVIANSAFSRQMQYGDKSSIEGQPLGNILNDIEANSKIKAMIENMESNSETRIADTMALAGFSTNVSISRSKSGNFTGIIFKEA